MADTAIPQQALTFKYRLLPTRKQHAALSRILEQQRQLYNAALEERIDCYRKTGKSLSAVDQSKSLTIIRRDDPEFSDIQRRIQRDTLNRLHRAYEAFFRRAKAGAGRESGFPRFKGREFFNGFGFDAFQQITLENKRLRFSGMCGGLRVRIDRPIPNTPLKVWFKRERRRWYVGFQVRVECNETCARQTIGVDVGVAMLAATSAGQVIKNPRALARSERELKRRQRAIQRCKRGSNGRRKARARMQAAWQRVVNVREGHAHKHAAILAKQHAGVAMEALKLRNMTRSARGTADDPGSNVAQKSGLNRAILDAGFGRFRSFLKYKCRREGATFIEVDPRYTSQTCSVCGAIDRESRRSQAEFVCTSCGYTANADFNAAVNIKRLGFNDTGGLARGVHNVAGYSVRAPRNTAVNAAGQRGFGPFHPLSPRRWG